MYRFSFKIKHRNCAETNLSTVFPDYYITVIDIQSRNPKEKQYLYHITGDPKNFYSIAKSFKNSNSYVYAKQIERSKKTLLMLVILKQTGYIQNIIQKHHGFFIDLHTVYGGFEYWHVGVIDRNSIIPMRKEISKLGDLKVLYIGQVDFAPALLSKQQNKIFSFAIQNGYYESPRKINISKMAKTLKLSSATVGEHLLKAENKLIKNAANKI